MRLTMTNTVRVAALMAGAAFAATLASAPAHAEIAGTLSCNIAPGTGVIVVSQRAVACTFRSSLGPVEFYTGTISRLGVDIGNQASGILSYNVYEGGTPAQGVLAGNYFGPGFGLTLGSGGGVNALIGGNANSIALQPLAATTSTGLNFNAGLGNLNLTYAGTERPPRMRRRHARLARA